MADSLVRRTLTTHLLRVARRFPVVTVTGPRQSGKTTLCRMAFPDRAYVNLEAPDIREYATSDPRGFLSEHRAGAILDEIQRAPALLSYLQAEVDARPAHGRFILTGSQHFGLLESVSQSLAGRTAVMHLMPFSLDELLRLQRPPHDLLSTLVAGGYPAVHRSQAPPDEWLQNYAATYLERDVRQVTMVGDLLAFQTFLRLSAGRSGQILNLSSLGADAGITHNTARSWLSVLETSFLAHRLPPLHRNFGKRLVKTAKLYLEDSGLLCHLLGIRNAGELRHHPLRGAVFETWVVSEIRKWRLHRGLVPALSFYRDQRGAEVDVVVEAGPRAIAVEVKSGATVTGDFFAGLEGLAEVWPGPARLECVLVYGGESGQRRRMARVLPWSELPSFAWN